MHCHPVCPKESSPFRRLVAAGAICLTITGCTTDGTFDKEIAGTLLGAAGGALLGSQIGSGSGRVLAVAGGTLLGAWLGNRIGASLDAADRAAIQERTMAALTTGEPQTWRNPDTGTEARIEVREEKSRAAEVKIPVLKDRVQSTPPLDFIGGTFAAAGATNVRGGPGTDYVIVDSLKPGEQVGVIGQVKGEPWYMISRNGVGAGFVSAALIKEVPDEEVVAEAQEAVVGEVAEQVIGGERECRTTIQNIRLADGTEGTEEVTACRGPNGWEIV